MLGYKITARIRDLGSKAEHVREEKPPTELDTSVALLGSGAAAGSTEVFLDLVTVSLRTGCN